MQSRRARTTRNRGKDRRTLTVREIKMAICTHDRLALAGPPEQRMAGGPWHTTLACPSCGATAILETPDSARLAPAAEVREPIAVTAAG
jgi:hypothetical protein